MSLPVYQKFAYSVGHVLNDLCAAMWFSYLLVFFHKVLMFSNTMAGNLLLIGQIADGIATPFVGYESDKTPFHCKYGRRKSWHLVGTLCVMLTFPLIFMECIDCNSDTSEYIKLIYYAPLVVIFQFGWASTQINHLALIPDLTKEDGEKVTLNALRYSFTVISSILVYGIAWLVLLMPNGSSSASLNHTLSPKDAPSFRILVLTTVGIGVAFSAFFHAGLKERQHRHHSVPAICSESTSVQDDECVEPKEDTPLIRKCTRVSTSQIHWYEWFKQPAFYQVALLYMCTRLVVNLSQVYMPMYLTDTLKLHKTYIAIVPLVTYLCGFVAALLARPISILIKQELIYALACVLVIGSCVWSHFLQEGSNQIFGMAVLMGFGNSTMLVVSLSLTAKLIGSETTTGAFVYGAMSLTDKISNGIAVEVIQYLNPCVCECIKCNTYFRSIMSYLIGGITTAALIVLITIYLSKRFHRHPTPEITTAKSESTGTVSA